MNKTSLSSIALLLLFISGTAFSPSPDATFWASTPCDPYLKGKIAIAEGVNCEFMKWTLTIGANKDWNAEVIYGESQPNTTGFKLGGSTMTLKGTYTINDGLYTLNSPKLKNPVYLKRIGLDLIHFTDDDKKLLNGNAGYSYTLNRKK